MTLESTSAELFYPYSRYLRETFGETTYKVPVASGLTCPTRDGSIASDGCAFCDLRGSASFFGKQGRGMSAGDQLRKRLPEIRERFGATKFLAYFQSYTNTYSDVLTLKKLYRDALSIEGISGLCISTRPDCLPDEVLGLLAEISANHYVSIELGIQSFHDETLLWLKRGHDGACSIQALEKLAQRAPSVDVCAHLIFGCPTEPRHLAADAARILNRVGARGVKLHQLMILKGSELGSSWQAQPFNTLSLEEYAERVLEFIEHLSPAIYLERLYATASHNEECLAPDWSRERWSTHNKLREYLESRGCRQGSRARKPSSDR